MKLPKTIDIYGLDVKIIQDHPVRDDDGALCDGTYCYQEKTIYIDSKLDKEDTIQTLIHEMGHCLLHRTSADLDMKVEEPLVNNFANMITEIFNLRFKRKKVQK